MFSTRQLRAAALGFGLAFLVSPPLPDGTIEIPDTYQALMSYPLEGIAETPEVICGEGEIVGTISGEGEHVDTLTAEVTFKFNC